MGISRATAYEIFSNQSDITVSAEGPDKKGKWAGRIRLSNKKGLVATHHGYNSAENALAEMKKFVAEIIASVLNDLQTPVAKAILEAAEKRTASNPSGNASGG